MKGSLSPLLYSMFTISISLLSFSNTEIFKYVYDISIWELFLEITLIYLVFILFFGVIGTDNAV